MLFRIFTTFANMREKNEIDDLILNRISEDKKTTAAAAVYSGSQIKKIKEGDSSFIPNNMKKLFSVLKFSSIEKAKICDYIFGSD